MQKSQTHKKKLHKRDRTRQANKQGSEKTATKNRLAVLRAAGVFCFLITPRTRRWRLEVFHQSLL
jgi:hypothetical protein